MRLNAETVAAARKVVGAQRRDLAWAWGLRGLPLGVIRFQWRARRIAHRTSDDFSLAAATRPSDTRLLIELARDRAHIVELGTATGWTAISLALADPARRIVSYDVVDREAGRYMNLVDEQVRNRIDLVIEPGSTGQRRDEPVDLLYIDSSHEREQTIAEVRSWQPFLRDGALVLFDDYMHPHYPGVHEAIEELRLAGNRLGTLFVHQHKVP